MLATYAKRHDHPFVYLYEKFLILFKQSIVRERKREDWREWEKIWYDPLTENKANDKQSAKALKNNDKKIRKENSSNQQNERMKSSIERKKQHSSDVYVGLNRNTGWWWWSQVLSNCSMFLHVEISLERKPNGESNRFNCLWLYSL